MKSTASNPTTATEQQRKGSRQNADTGAGVRRQPINAAATASQTATTRARRGNSLKAGRKSERSPKHENL